MKKEQIKQVLVILLIQIFLFRTSFIEQRSHVFFICCLYFVILVFYWDLFSVKEMITQIKSGKKFWIVTGVTFAVEALFLGIVHIVNSTLLVDANVGTMSIVTSSDFDLLLYYLVLIIVEPVAINLFYRKVLISFDSPALTIGTTIASILLIGIMNANGIIGILETCIICVPITLVYLANRNIYVSIIAMYGCTLITNFASLAKVLGRIVLR